MIRRRGERGSWISVQAALHDDDDIHTYIYIHTHTHTYIYIHIYARIWY